MPSFIRSIPRALAATSALALVLGAIPAFADEDAPGPDGADPGVARLSVLRGNVEVKRADSGDTVAGAINAPISAGDYVTTHDASRVEIEYGYGSAVRVGSNTQLRFTHLDPDSHALQLAEGTVEMRVFRGLEAHPEVETPAATIRPDERGQYRITVNHDGNTEVTVRSGHADVLTQSGTQTLAPDSTLLIEGEGNNVHFQTIETVALDGFDAWNDQRDRAFERVRDYNYVDQGIVGADDLDQYGQWVDEPTYGRVWQPYETADWAPYHDGRWVWEPYYGWTWVGDEPWGYAPYHYGNWFYADSRWCWYPGAYAAARVYRPALVGFFSFGFGGGGFSLGFGNIGWVPLAPFEPFHPWWGRGFDNRTTIVNNINIRNVNITNVNIYRNLRAPNGAVAVSNANFANGNFSHPIPVRASELKAVTAVRGVVPVVPTEHNLAFSAHAAAVAPGAVQLSGRFASFKAAQVARPPSFNTQRETVATAAQKLYPEHAAAIAHPETLPRAASNGLVPATNERGGATERVGATEAGAASERGVTTERSASEPATNERASAANAPAERSTARDPWSRFGDGGSPATHTSASRETPASTTPETSRATSVAPNSARSTAAGSTSGASAWHRFNDNGAAESGTTTRSNAPGATTGRRYDGYGSPANAAAPSTTQRSSASRGADYGSSVPRSTPSYRQTPTYHAPPATRPAAPASHAAARPAPPSGGGSHQAPPSKSTPSKPEHQDH